MTMSTVVNGILESFKTRDVYKFNVTEFYEESLKKIDSSFRAGNELDPRVQQKASTACNELFTLAREAFFNIGYHDAAIKLLIHGWNEFAKVQYAEGLRVYRAGFAVWLATLYLLLKDEGAAFRWALLTHVDDALGQHFSGGAGYQLLRTRFGLREELIDSFNQIAQTNLDIVREQWSISSAFAEDVALRTILQEPDLASFLSLPTLVNEYPLDNAYFNALLDRVNTSELGDAKFKGDALEDLASYLFLLIPGWIPRRNVVDNYSNTEFDIVVRNYRRQTDLYSELFGRHFVVECKNLSSSAKASHVGYFLQLMHLAHADFGIIFSTNGITGNGEDETAARSLINKSFHEDGKICIVIDRSDLEKIAETKLSFSSLLIRKLEDMRFGKSKQENSNYS